MSGHNPVAARLNSILCASPTHGCVDMFVSFEYGFDGVLHAKSFDRELLPLLNGHEGLLIQAYQQTIARTSRDRRHIGECLQ